MKTLRTALILSLLGLLTYTGCGGDDSSLPPPKEGGGGGVVSDQASQKELDRLKQLGKQKPPKSTPNQN